MRLRRLAPVVICLALAVGAGQAHAQSECDAPYSSSMVSEDLGVMTLALRDLDEEAFNSAGARMDAGLPCMTEALPVAAYASAFRFLGAWRYLTGDKDMGLRWFRTAIEVDPAFSWDINDLPQGHPLREAFEAERAMAGQPAVGMEGMVLDPPGGTQIMVDGRVIDEPSVTTGRPHLLQVVETDTRVVREGWLMDGSAIPDKYLITEKEAAERAAALADADGKKSKKNKKDRDTATATTASVDDPYAVQSVTRIRPKAKTPLLIAGAAGIVASGVVYGMSFPARQRFDDATTTDDLLATQTATNTLVIASGATLAVGMGLGIVGIQLDSTPGLVIGRAF